MQTKDRTSEVIQKLMSVIEALPSRDNAQRYKATLVNLEQKYEDPEFRLAVIGNFSCGKSTFLNALLQRSLLTVDTQPTTAIPTYIRWNKSTITQRLTRQREEQRRKRSLWRKIIDFFRELFHKLPPIDQYPEEPYINVYGTNQKEYLLYGDGIADFERDLGISLPSEISKTVDFLTTTNALAAKIKKIELFFPEREGFQNFCLIDTPGVNPGDEASENHIVQTQSVLRKEADAAIVLYPAKDAMSKDLERFITENAAHLMEDAIVLLTKMDIVPSEKEREKILKRTQQLVAKRFHQTEPIVYGISAFEALEYRCFNSPDPQSKEWFEIFNNVFSNVFSSLRQRRSQIANKRISHLLTELMQTIDAEISASTKQLQEERQSIQDCSMEKLELAYAELVKEQERLTSSAALGLHSDAKRIVWDSIQARRKPIIELLDSATNSPFLQCRVGYTAPLQMADVTQVITEEIQKTVIPKYTQMNQAFSKKVGDCLKRYKRDFGEVPAKEAVLPDKTLTPAKSAFPCQRRISETGYKILCFLFGLVTMGIGLLILLIPLLVDLFTFKKKRAAAITDMNARISNYEQKLLEELDKALKSVEQANADWAANLLTEYRNTYRALFEEADQIYRIREENLTALIRQNEDCLSRLTDLQRLCLPEENQPDGFQEADMFDD